MVRRMVKAVELCGTAADQVFWVDAEDYEVAIDLLKPFTTVHRAS
jgi:hypothetical protein